MSAPRQIALGQTFREKFNTFRFSSGAPFTLAGTPSMSVYEDDNETQITAGLTLTVDYDSITGLHEVECAATSGNGYEATKVYTMHVAAGTVDSVSAVGVQVAKFQIESASTLAARELYEKMYPGHVLGASGSHSATVMDLTGVIDADTPADALNGEIGLFWDSSTGVMYLVEATDFAATTLLMTMRGLDGITLPTPAAGDMFWRAGALAGLLPTTVGRKLTVSAGGLGSADVKQINAVEVIGAGTSGDKWRAA